MAWTLSQFEFSNRLAISDNFLPEYQPRVNRGTKKTLQCLVRDKAVTATKEEAVRQRVLNWLIHYKGWEKEYIRLEKSYKWVSDPERKRIRPDIELLSRGGVSVIVECKAPDIRLDDYVRQQAVDYAIKADAPWIWTTNGENHAFFKRVKSSWHPVRKLQPIDLVLSPTVKEIPDPANLKTKSEINRYWRLFGDQQFKEGGKFDISLVLAIHRVLFHIKKRVPYSSSGVHILEDRGSAWHTFNNASGMGYHTRYADFVAATSGRVESVSISINLWGSDHLRICVGITKPTYRHHALQLDTDLCEWDESIECWHVYHLGRASRIRTQTVFEAVREAGCGHWIHTDSDGKELLYFGKLYRAETANWRNSKELLANLIHYAIIRSNLRDARSA